MNMTAQVQAKPTPMPSFTPVRANLPQRKCACGGTPGPDGECVACRQKRLSLQRRSANQAEASASASLVHDKHLSSGPLLKQDTLASVKPHFGHNFNRVTVAAQGKLTLSQPGDKYEQEADRVAEEVMRLGTGDIQLTHHSSPHPAARPSNLVQRQGEVIELDEDDLKTEDEASLIEREDEDEIVADESGMPKRESSAGGFSTSQTASIRVSASGGQPLDAEARDFMEQHIGHDFSRVRVHTDARAVGSARQLRAHAYTVGSDIYFNEGRYDPGNVEGLKLLAHELTHVVQQTASYPAAAHATGQVQRQRTKPRRGPAPVPSRRPGQGGTRSPKERRSDGPGGDCAKSKAPVNTHDCTTGGSANESNFITDLTVFRADHKVVATWKSGASKEWDCSPSTEWGPKIKVKTASGMKESQKEPTPLTPLDEPHSIGLKCGKDHTNLNGDGMGWFTGFFEGQRIGFHNSQAVGPKPIESHGCVRVSCKDAKTIHDHSKSGVTTVHVFADKGEFLDQKKSRPLEIPLEMGR